MSQAQNTNNNTSEKLQQFQFIKKLGKLPLLLPALPIDFSDRRWRIQQCLQSQAIGGQRNLCSQKSENGETV
jgi:hypothetical protein